MSDKPAAGELTRRHTISLTVRQRDTDHLGIVYNPVYLDYAMEAAFRHAAALGFDLGRSASTGGYFIVRRHLIEYRRAARAGDELLVTTEITAMKGAQATRTTTIVDAATGSLVASGTTDYIWLKENGRPGRIPAAVLATFDWLATPD
ncbi:MAG: acyl-CoA thioesterase [Chloroflexota bacterium]